MRSTPYLGKLLVRASSLGMGLGFRDSGLGFGDLRNGKEDGKQHVIRDHIGPIVVLHWKLTTAALGLGFRVTLQ